MRVRVCYWGKQGPELLEHRLATYAAIVAEAIGRR